MKLLFIGGTGLISSACSDLALARGHELTVLNRAQSTRYPTPTGARLITGDIHAGPRALADLLRGQTFDAVVDWIAYKPEDIERDIEVFSGQTGKFVFISSASAYQKPPQNYLISEETPLENPFWQYSRDKITIEARLMGEYQRRGFPVSIVRPSLTYGPSQIPLAIGSWQHPYTLIDRMRRGQPVIVPGDGTSLWVVTWNADFAKAFIGLLGRPEAIGEAYTITSDEVLTWNQLYQQVYDALGVEPNMVPIPSPLIAAYDPGSSEGLLGDKCHSVIFDNTKIKRLVPDFTCEVNWAEGVRRSLAWFDADPARRTIDAPANTTWDRILAGYARAWPQ